MTYHSAMPGSPEIPAGGDALIAALEEVLEANRSLQGVLRASEERTRQYIALLAAGSPVADVVRSTPAVTPRNEGNSAIANFTRARQRSRSVAFLRLIEEGMSRKEIAGNWGFSQQVVSRIVNNPDPGVSRPVE